MPGEAIIFDKKEKRRIAGEFQDLCLTCGTCAGGCPIGNLAQEMGDLSSKFSLKLKASIDLMVEAYARVLAEAQEAGDISKGLDVKEAAYFIVASWHGAIIQMKLTKDLAPLETHRKFIFKKILNT